MSELKYLEEYGVYVTDDGKVLREIKQWEDKSGYKYVTINDSEHRNQQVHRLVAKAFIPIDESSDGTVMHKDDNPRNNNVDNLKWGTKAENNRDAVLHGLHKFRPVCVRCKETGEVFPSARQAGFAVGAKGNVGYHILQASKNERCSAYGYHWERVNKD